MSEIDKLSHYERGLESKYRIAVRQARCVDVPSAMAEVDIVADAYQTNVKLPQATTPTLARSTVPHMGVEPMQIAVLRNKKYGRPQQPRIKNGPRQGRNNNNGPSSSYPTSNMSGARCWNCGQSGHRFFQCKKAKRVHISMLTTHSILTNDDEEVSELRSEGAVDPAIQAEVPSGLHATVPTCQERTGMRQPIQTMVVTRQNTADGRPRSRTVFAGGAPRDVHEDRDSPCVHANLPAAEQEEGWYAREDTSQPREGFPTRGDGNQRDLGCKPPTTINHKAPEADNAFLLWPSSTIYAYNVCGRQLIHPHNGYTVRCCSATGNRHPTVG